MKSLKKNEAKRANLVKALRLVAPNVPSILSPQAKEVGKIPTGEICAALASENAFAQNENEQPKGSQDILEIKDAPPALQSVQCADSETQKPPNPPLVPTHAEISLPVAISRPPVRPAPVAKPVRCVAPALDRRPVALPATSLPAPQYCPSYSPWGMAGYPPMMLYPATTMYGQVQPLGANHSPGATVIYTSGPISSGNGAIILVPMGGHACIKETKPPGDSSACHSAVTTSDTAGTFLVLIERNVFKHWFDGNMSKELTQFPKIKRFKSSETFMHWVLTKRRLISESNFSILMRVTEIRNLMSELGKYFPNSVINSRITKSIFAYEHLFASEKPSKTIWKNSLPSEIKVSHCLGDACALAGTAARQPTDNN